MNFSRSDLKTDVIEDGIAIHSFLAEILNADFHLGTVEEERATGRRVRGEATIAIATEVEVAIAIELPIAIAIAIATAKEQQEAQEILGHDEIKEEQALRRHGSKLEPMTVER